MTLLEKLTLRELQCKSAKSLSTMQAAKNNIWQSWSKSNNRLSSIITDAPSTAINTSCEHMGKFDARCDRFMKISFK
jgi:hypothetical protein